jgi:hypothetical protein
VWEVTLDTQALHLSINGPSIWADRNPVNSPAERTKRGRDYTVYCTWKQGYAIIYIALILVVGTHQLRCIYIDWNLSLLSAFSLVREAEYTGCGNIKHRGLKAIEY